MELCSRFHPEPTVSGFENRTENKRARSMNSKDPLFLPPAAGPTALSQEGAAAALLLRLRPSAVPQSQATAAAAAHLC